MWNCSFKSLISLFPLPPALFPGGFVVLDLAGGSEESSTDDDGGAGGDVGIDMRKLLSSSSQSGGGDGSGPNLSRQLMTHLRLLQADLQYLKVSDTRCGGKSCLEVVDV